LLQSGDAYLVDLRKKHRGRVELEEVQDDSDDESSASPRYALPLLLLLPCRYSARDRSAMTVAQFDPTGRHIFVGTSTGSILVFNTRTKTVSCVFVCFSRLTKLGEQMVARHKIPGAGIMKGFDFAKSGR
jgi:COMPASS component SWD1